jgi:hypothetical protein
MTRALVVTLALAATSLLASTGSWSLKSPDGLCEISVSLDGGGALSYQVSRAGKPVLLKSPLGLRRDDTRLDLDLALEKAGGPQTRRETYDLFAGTSPHVDHTLNSRGLVFTNRQGARLALDLAAGNEGVAFRYRFPDSSSGDQVRVLEAESTGFTLPSEARGWLQPYHAAGPYTPAYEDFFFHVSPGDPPPRSRQTPVGWAFPALFQVARSGTWVLLTESGTDASFCACHLAPDSSNGVYRIAFPLADEATRHYTNRFGPEPRSTLPWTMPWRVIVLGKTAGEIALSTLVTDLAPPSRIADTSWIKPGRASWAWWAYPEQPITVERFNEFADFAARMGWEYTLFDAGWTTPVLTNIAGHALAKGVAPLTWMFAADFYDPVRRRARLDEVVAAGVRGVKVDFWCSDRQEAIAAMHGLFEDAAARRLVVNLHGCTLPRGWQRTWPNFLTAEAVLGVESYMFESNYTDKAAELNAVLPFTRNAVGPMDTTPVGCSPKKFPRTTTAAHELAAAIILTSGIIHYADKPEFFESLPAEAQRVLRDAPARWDETRCLVGEPGRAAVFAKRSGKSWFIAGLNGASQPLPVDLDLKPFRRFKRRLLISEGADLKMEVAAASVSVSPSWKHIVPPRGGFILRLDEGSAPRVSLSK